MRVSEAASLIAGRYADFDREFMDLTRSVAARFRACDWRGGQRDARMRLLLYPRSVRSTVAEIEELLGDHALDSTYGGALKVAFSREIEARPDVELAETFFNSVARRVLGTVGVDEDSEFTGKDGRTGATPRSAAAVRSYLTPEITEEVLERVLADAFPADSYRGLEADAALGARIATRQLSEAGEGPISGIEMLPAPFYRNKAAYLVGRLMRGGSVAAPLVLPLLNSPAGIELDAVLTTSDEASVVFGFTRSYFHVESECPREVVDFLTTIMPRKRRDELYTATGHHKHGKREMYAALMEHLRDPSAILRPAEGQKGLVMIVFTLPSFNVVFKVIRDVFGYGKNASRDEVMGKYHLVFIHDRVGRLADAQQFEHLEIGREHFAPELLEELLSEAASTVHLRDDTVVIGHLYTERRVRPLDLFLDEAPADEAVRAVVDYGNAVKDLAAANIFPGDMLLKNFGVTRHGRVVFYDYDELSLLTDCRFRRIPRAREPEHEMAAEPWFHVEPGDVFPEEFRPFLMPAGPLRELFMERHAELVDVDFWRSMQERQEAGEVVDFFPYPRWRRLCDVRVAAAPSQSS